ncbi:MAG: hypothetical protein WC657_07035 [Candidatus Paceibacterota bacterium]|jgi:hypothetical protein
MSLAGTSHDISLVDTVEVGFMCSRDKYGRPAYSEGMASPLTALQASGINPDALNPDKSYPVVTQGGWHGGFGQEWYTGLQPHRYLSSYGCDLSSPGCAKLGPKWNAIAWPTVPSYALANGNMETWTSGTDASSWTEALGAGGGAVAQEGTTKYAGTYAAKITGGSSGAGTTTTMTQSVTWNNDFRSKKFRLTAYCHKVSANPATMTIRLYDGKTYTSTNTSGTDAYELVTVTKTLAADATELTAVLQVTGGSESIGVGYVDSVALTGYTMSTSETHYAEFGGYQYMSCGTNLYKTDSATAPTAWTIVSNFYDNITDLYSAQVSGTSYLWICLGGSSAMNYYDGTTFTACSGTTPNGSYVVSVGGAATDTYWKAETPNIVRSQVAPLAGNWSSPTYIGGTDNDITDLLVVGTDLYVIKEDGIYAVDSSGNIDPVASGLKDYRKDGAGKNSCVKDSKIYVPMGSNALIEYDPVYGSWGNISPAVTMATTASGQQTDAMTYASQADFDGQIFAVTALGEYLYVIQDCGSTNNLFKGIYANIDGFTGWAWHPIASTTMGDATALAATLLSGVEWIWVGQGTGNPGYYDPTHYVSSGYFVTPWFNGGVKHITKEVIDFVAGVQSISAAHYYGTVYFQFYGDTTWDSTTLALNTTTTTGEISNFMPDNSYGTAIRYKILLQTDDADYSPQVNYFQAAGKIRPTEIPIITCQIILCDNGVTRHGAKDGFKAARKLTALNNSIASNWPVTMYDIAGTSRTVDLLSRVQAMVNYDEWGRLVYAYDLVFQRVTTS